MGISRSGISRNGISRAGISTGLVSPTSEYFGFTVDTTNAGSAANTMIVPLVSGESYDFFINWGDGTIESFTSSILTNVTHVYSVGGVFDIKVTGVFPRIFFNNTGDILKMLSINNWGNIAWSSMMDAFRGCANLVANYSDVPNLSAVTNLNGTFRNCSLWNGTWQDADCSSVTDAANLYFSASVYNQPMPTMDNVVLLTNALRNTVFNQSIDNLPMLNVTAAVTFMSNVSTFSTANYDSWLSVIDGTALNTGVSIHFGNTQYTNTSGHDYLTIIKTWTVVDGGQVP